MQIFFSVGEPSGDQHAAQLIGELRRRRPDLEFVGYGGPRMEQAGCRLHCEMTSLAVMGLFQTIPLLWRFCRLLFQAGRYFRRHRPDAVILVDFPGFNWWIARQAKAAGIPVFYYLPPQIWAWASWRIERIRRYVDHVLCALPFEPRWYAERGVEVDYVGHPFYDEVSGYRLDGRFLQEQRAEGRRHVGILPGSRNHEVRGNFPLMIEVMKRVGERHRDVRFHVACYKESYRQVCRSMLERRSIEFPVELHVGRTPEIIELAECCLMVSGSVSLEMLARGTPAVVLYRVSRMTRWLFRPLIHCRFMSLPNLFADREVMPEVLSYGRPERQIARMTELLSDWLSDERALAARTRQMRELRRKTAALGASGRAAEAVLSHLTAVQSRRAA